MVKRIVFQMQDSDWDILENPEFTLGIFEHKSYLHFT